MRRCTIIVVVAGLALVGCSGDDAAEVASTPAPIGADDGDPTTGPRRDLAAITPHPDSPVITPTDGGWDAQYTAVPYVVRDGDAWLMFYTGSRGQGTRVGIARSTDLETWTKDPEPLRLEGQPGAPSWIQVVDTGEQWVMTFVTTWRPPYEEVYRATAPAPEGPWVVDDEPVFTGGEPGDWDDLVVPTGITRVGDRYLMVYGGWADADAAPAIGIATSDDTVTWQRADAPVLTATPDAWNAFGVIGTTIVTVEDRLELLTLGFHTTPSVSRTQDTYQLGRLVSDDGGATWQVDHDGQPLIDTMESGWPGVSVVAELDRRWVFAGHDLGTGGIALLTGMLDG